MADPRWDDFFARLKALEDAVFKKSAKPEKEEAAKPKKG